MEEVDAFLDAVRDTFLGVRQPPLTAEEIRTKMFATTRLRPGYDEEQVDAFLDAAETRLRAKCAECGAETAQVTAFCARCGAPVPERPQQEAPGPRPANQKAAKPYKTLLGWILGILLNLVALWIAIGFVVTAIIEGSPAQEGPNYVPLWACAFIAIVFSIVPAVSVVILVDRRRKRRATASDSPELLPESLD